MTTEQHGSKTDRIAELERMLSTIRETYGVGLMTTEKTETVRMIEAELSRLRNEGGDSKTEEGRGVDDLAKYLLNPWVRISEGAWRISEQRNDMTIYAKRALDWFAQHRAIPSPLASVEAGRGEREALERAADTARRAIDLLGEARSGYIGGSSPDEAWDKARADLVSDLNDLRDAALSRGNGEAVAWQFRESVSDPWFFCTEREAKTFGHEYRALYAAPPSQPEGVREALEAAAKICDDYGREGDHLSKAFECETADELAARIRNLKLTTTPSRGLVEVAEAHSAEALEDAAIHLEARAFDLAEDYEKPELSEKVGDIAEELRERLRTLSANGTANADGGRDG